MRHFLKFLSRERRAEAERQQPVKPGAMDATKAEPKKPLPPRVNVPAAAKPAPRVATPGAAKAASGAANPRAAGRVAQSRSAPEFGGLIERRKVSRDAPVASGPEGQKSRPIANKTPVTEKSWDTRFDIDAKEIKDKLEAAARNSTGVFLASLDNSAITLADSGLFKLAEEEEVDEKRKKPESFNPYDHN